MAYKIGIIIDSLGGGGAEKVMMRLCEKFAEDGHEIHFFLTTNIIKYVDAHSYSVHILKYEKPILMLPQLHCIKLAKKLKDIVNAESLEKSFDAFFSVGLVANRVTNFFSHKSIYYCIHGDLYDKLSTSCHGSFLKYYYLKMRWRSYFNKKKVIVVSEYLKNSMLNRLKSKPREIDVIYNPFDFEEIRTLSSREDVMKIGAPYIVHCGRFNPVKDHPTLFEAFSKVDEKWKLVLIVEDSDSLRKMINSFGLESRVIITGFLQNPFPLMKKADLSVLCSTSEGFGNAVVESLICGTPVVSTNVGGVAEIMKGELAEWLIPASSPKLLADKIIKALNSDIRIDDRLLNKFRIELIVKQYLELIH